MYCSYVLYIYTVHTYLCTYSCTSCTCMYVCCILFYYTSFQFNSGGILTILDTKEKRNIIDDEGSGSFSDIVDVTSCLRLIGK